MRLYITDSDLYFDYVVELKELHRERKFNVKRFGQESGYGFGIPYLVTDDLWIMYQGTTLDGKTVFLVYPSSIGSEAGYKNMVKDGYINTVEWKDWFSFVEEELAGMGYVTENVFNFLDNHGIMYEKYGE